MYRVSEVQKKHLSKSMHSGISDRISVLTVLISLPLYLVFVALQLSIVTQTLTGFLTENSKALNE